MEISMQIPRYVEVSDVQGGQHKLSVKILGTEETWNTPSLMLAQNSNSGGIAVFSQVKKNFERRKIFKNINFDALFRSILKLIQRIMK